MLASRLALIVGDSFPKLDTFANKDDREKYILEKCEKRLKKFNATIVQNNLINRMSDEEYQKKMEILDELEEGLRDVEFTKRLNENNLRLNAVSPFGSSITDLANKKGDLDIVLSIEHLKSNEKIDTDRFILKLLEFIYRRINKNVYWKTRNVKNLQVFDSARVPIINCFVDNIEIDISICLDSDPPTAYLSSQVININASYDRRFIELCSYVKYWMKSMINPNNEEESEGYIPKSCVISLMVLHFMVHYKILPPVHTLHSEKLNQSQVTWKMVRAGELGAFGVPRDYKKKWRRENYTEASIGVLFLLFLDYYTKIVDLRKNVLVIKTATCEMKKPRKSIRDKDPSMTLVVSDAYDSDTNYARRIDNVPVLIRKMSDKYAEVFQSVKTETKGVSQKTSQQPKKMSPSIATRLKTILGEHDLRDELMTPLDDAIDDCDRVIDKDADEYKGDRGLVDSLEKFFRDPKQVRELKRRNVYFNDVIALGNTYGGLDNLRDRDLTIIISIGLRNLYENLLPDRKINVQARHRSRKLLEYMMKHLWTNSKNSILVDLKHVERHIPFIQCEVDGVKVAICVSVKPFVGHQYMSERLIKQYEQFDDAFSPLCGFLQKYFNSKIRGNQKQLQRALKYVPKPNNTAIMVVHFFKYYGIFPANLNETDEIHWDKKTNEDVTYLELFYAFLDYYTNIVNLEEYVLEISTGKIIEKDYLGFKNTNILSINDIVDDHNPGERVNNVENYKDLCRAAMVAIKRKFIRTKNNVIDDLMNIPIRPNKGHLADPFMTEGEKVPVRIDASYIANELAKLTVSC